MASLLPAFLDAGLIEKLDGDDQRYAKLEKAAEALAEGFRERPEDLIRAILAGLDPDIPAQDPMVQQAKQALQAEWKTMSGVYTDEPIGSMPFPVEFDFNQGPGSVPIRALVT